MSSVSGSRNRRHRTRRTFLIDGVDGVSIGKTPLFIAAETWPEIALRSAQLQNIDVIPSEANDIGEYSGRARLACNRLIGARDPGFTQSLKR